ncbi:MAG: hypothetical protein WHS88_02665 [Anaerohalosphaeraceae bacterium]
MDYPLEHFFEYRQSLTNETPRSLPNERGVLLFADSNNCPIQLLQTASIRRTVLTRLSAPPAGELSRKASLRPLAASVLYTLVSSDYHAFWLYSRLVNLFFPQQSRDLLPLPPAHCVRLNPQEPWAAFAVSAQPFRDKEAVYWGPFATRSDADFFARTWNDIFCLCRNRTLALAGNGSKCTYFQMNLCPADCVKKEQNIPYPQRLKQALEAAQSSPASLQNPLTERMKMLAAQLQFEQAQVIKKQLESLEKLQTAPYRWTTPLERLKILHISEYRCIRFQKRPVPLYQAFVITGQTAEKLPCFSLESAENLLQIAQTPPGRCLLEPQNLSEHISRLSVFLYKTAPPGIWLNLNKPLVPNRFKEKLQEWLEKTVSETK